MPFTAYHFGPSGFVGLVFKRLIDLPVFVLANVAIDVEVLILYVLGLGWPHHRYCHTFLFSPFVGAGLAIVAWPMRNFLKKIMSAVHLTYGTSFKKRLVWAILGCWFHVFIDSFDHWDVEPFWPYSKNPFFGIITDSQIKIICLAFWVAAFILWVFQLRFAKRRSQLTTHGSIGV